LGKYGLPIDISALEIFLYLYILTTMKQKIIVYTDGGARGNPGSAGAGAYITDGAGKKLKEISVFLGHQTNNWAEYEAVALGLMGIKKLFGAQTKSLDVEVRLDSELVARQLSNIYQIKEETLFSQYIKVHNILVKDFSHVLFVHVPREKNKDADRLANDAMDRGQ
jgi:ribonuclease HI